MTQYREIIRLTSLGLSQRNIMRSLGAAHKTVVKVQHRAKELSLEWPLNESLTDKALQKIMFPTKQGSDTSKKRMPDFAYIHKELLRNGVSKKLLWTEYMEECRQAGEEPLMYSQFCYYIQRDEQKQRATMHINRKPAEQVKVDWAGDPARIIDPDTGEIINAYLFVCVMTYSQYAYVEAFVNEKQQTWITAHVHMYEMKEIPFEDRLGMLVDIEYTSRKNNRLKRLIKLAEFDQPDASVMDINYTSGPKLNKSLIQRLASCEYIAEHRNLFITGATGSGKSYMACAFGMEACKQYINIKYVRLPDLLIDLEMARNEGTYKKVMSKYANPVLLIIDEWLLLKPTENEQKDIFELSHRRRKRSSTIFCSQYRQEGWYEQLGGNASPLADAILDRIVHDAYIINIESISPEKNISMREVYGLNKSLSE